VFVGFPGKLIFTGIEIHRGDWKRGTGGGKFSSTAFYSPGFSASPMHAPFQKRHF